MKKIGIVLKLDSFGKYNEKRENIDVRFINLLQGLNFLPILIWLHNVLNLALLIFFILLKYKDKLKHFFSPIFDIPNEYTN